ncbi:MAG: nicotinate-nucleotide--dimethylbenzimidazole phosphoribosyltransferase [Deltaproteobacteria bacterium]|nr:MAG: nicotinate-nucleotide--dimethylbenzimidazole phosphoribosyltransferase [Deltaproteobacteria bacterium]
MRESLEKTLAAILPLKEEFLSQAQERLDRLTKPVGSLGQLEEIAKRYAAIVEKVKPVLGKKIIYTFAADHGVVAEGVSAYPKEVTHQMVYNFLHQGAGINVLARHAGAEVVVVDIGVDHDFEPAAGLVIRKIAHGTRNLAQGPALTLAEALRAIAVGLEMADRARAEGATLVGTGDMGIGNTTASSAILSCLAGLPVEEVTHRGTGIDDPGLRRKIRTIEQAIRVNAPDPRDPLDVLAKVGGLEIAGIAGLIIGCAFHRIPVVVDGFISAAGAMIAADLNPAIREYLFASHQSVEIGHRFMWEYLGQKPIVNLSLRLGEGTGAALAMSIIEAAVKILTEMATFTEAGVAERNS